MDTYITAQTLRKLREKHKQTQSQLAARLDVSDKTISKWETGKGLPDIVLLEPLARELGISVAELFSGDIATNTNLSANMLKSAFYVCPICGNIICATGHAAISCHGITLQPLVAEETETTPLRCEQVEDEYYVTIHHPMTKTHYVSFIAAVSPDRIQLVKTYPESLAEARFKIAGVRDFYWYCNRDGLFRVSLKSIQ